MKLGANHPIGRSRWPTSSASTCLAVMDVFVKDFGDPKYRACRCCARW